MPQTLDTIRRRERDTLCRYTRWNVPTRPGFVPQLGSATQGPLVELELGYRVAAAILCGPRHG